MSWLASWLPSFPSFSYFAVPASIQRRFISFILKRALGHFLKPGQLDVQQIDSQIGSGYVQVNDLHLDNNAINDIISQSGMPLELVDGTAASVTARIPWPNPLTSTLGFSLSSLHITLRVVPAEQRHDDADINLSESVASYAESFIHDELNPREEADLRESFRQDLSASSVHESDDDNVPGGLNPFRNFSEAEELADVDPDGVSLFATLIERLLAKFEFDATDTKVTIIHPHSSRFTLSVANIRYCTETSSSTEDIPTDNSERTGESRTVSLSGITLSGSNLRPHSSYPISPDRQPSSPSSMPIPRSPSPSSSSSSSSSIDEETQWAMSQSVAFLPPRSESPAESVASSLYESAISQHESPIQSSNKPMELLPSPITNSKADFDEIDEDILLSFGTDAVNIRLATPPVRGRMSSPTSLENIHISVEVGIISCAIRPWHISSLVNFADAITVGAFQHPPPPNSSSNDSTSQSIPAAGKQLSLSVKAVVILLLSTPVISSPSRSSLGTYFSRPRVPPSLREGYVRVFLDDICATVAISTDSKPRETQSRSDVTTSTLSSSLVLNEMSIFACPSANDSEAEPLAFPVLITDSLLPSQYIHEHKHPTTTSDFPILPDVDIIDWTTEAARRQGMRPSTWRTKQKQSKASHSQGPTFSSTGQGETTFPALSVKSERQSSQSSSHKANILKDDTRIEFAPLQIFVDLQYLLGEESINSYVDEVLSALQTSNVVNPNKADMNDRGAANQDDDTPPATPRVGDYRRSTAEREEERRKLEQAVLRDLDLHLDYRRPTSTDTRSSNRKQSTRHTANEGPNLIVHFPFVRANLRCTSRDVRSSRSGAVVLDIQQLALTKGNAYTSRKTASFEPQSTTQRSKPTENIMVEIELRRLVIASSAAGSSRAAAMLSIGHLQDEDSEFESRPLLPRILVSQSRQGSASTTMLNLSLPSLFVNLSKDPLDALQYWVDDASQLAQKASQYSSSDGGTEKAVSRESSLIGSHYFAKSNTASGATSLASNSAEVKVDTAVKVFISEAFCRIQLRRAEHQIIRPFDIEASDIETTIQIKPEGKDETVATLALMNLTINDHTSNKGVRTLISLTKAQSLRQEPQPLIKLRFTSEIVPETMAKESRVRIRLWGFTYQLFPDFSWLSDLVVFTSAPPGAFETVVPSERTKITLRVVNGSVKVLAPTHPGALLLHIGNLDLATDLIGESPKLEFMLKVYSAALLGIDDMAEFHVSTTSAESFSFWKKCGFVLLSEITDFMLRFEGLKNAKDPDTNIVIQKLGLRLHLCADTMGTIGDLIGDLVTTLKRPSEEQTPKPQRKPLVISEQQPNAGGIMSSVDNMAFKKVPEIGPAPDMIHDDLPRNPDYLDESFGAAGGFRELNEEDLNDFRDDEEVFPAVSSDDNDGVVSRVGGETIRLFRPEGLHFVDYYFDNLPPISENSPADTRDTALHVQVHDTDVNVFLYDGYDWSSTRKVIENEIKEMRKRLAKIKQLVAKGQTQQFTGEETSTLLFNSVYIGLKEDADELDSNALIAAIDEELKEEVDTTTESSWQSLPRTSQPQLSVRSTRLNGKRLVRGKSPSIEFRVAGLSADFAQYHPADPLVSRVFATVTDLEILDHIKSSTWKKFLTALRSDSRGNVRETDSHMVKVELRTIRPVADDPSEEARLKAKILPLRLHVDQDALDFMKKFFGFTDPNRPSTPAGPDEGIYFQLAEIFPVDLKLDYKPRRVDYRALKEGKTIELMNFFHFDGAEMTLRHITLSGITGWPRLGELLNDLWTPDVKATQLVDVISGVAPIRSVVNVGSGIADLVLLPIAQYKKDGRIVRGVQKGTTAFVKSTAIEAIKLGAKLATGTQVILEQAEGVLGPQFKYPITAETLQSPNLADDLLDVGFDSSSDEEENTVDRISKYAEQPSNVKEGVQSAYKSLQRNLNSAAQTILAVPMEVYERSGNEGPVRSVIRAVPIAVLKPMIGASEAVSKTLLGLHNTLDPNLRYENDAKYKHR